MKTKIILIKPAQRKRNWLRALYIITKRKLRKINDEKLIVLLSAMVFLMQLFIILTAMATPMHASAQDSVKQVPVKSAGLQIGDKVPDVTITNIINYKTPTAKISDFKGKLLILDFWSTWCSACFPALQKLDSLSRIFPGEVDFLPVTNQSKAIAREVWKKHGYSLPTVIQDKELEKLFPFRYLPHVVWIMDGKVKAITTSKEVNAANIRSMLNAGSPVMPAKVDIMDFDTQKPLFVNGNGGKGDKLLYHSVLAGYTPGLPSQYSRITGAGNTQKLCYTNTSILKLYQDAFRDDERFIEYPNRVMYFIPDSIRKRLEPQKEDSGWREIHSVSYDLQLPAAWNGQALRLMQEDLNRFFENYYGITGQVERRQINCLALELTGRNRLKSSGGTPKRTVTKSSYSISNLPLSNLVNTLAKSHPTIETPIVDFTGYTANVDLELNADIMDLAAVNKELHKYGLQLKQGNREIGMLVFRMSAKAEQSRTFN